MDDSEYEIACPFTLVERACRTHGQGHRARWALAACGGAPRSVTVCDREPPAGALQTVGKAEFTCIPQALPVNPASAKKGARGMHVETLLRHVHPIKGFTYQPGTMAGKRGGERLQFRILPHRRNRPICSACGEPGSCHDRLPERGFQMVPLWGIPVFLTYRMRRVNCKRCARVVVERVPWATGKSQMTVVFMAFLASWAKVVSWKEVGVRFRVSWDTVYRAVSWIVEYGKEHRSLEGITALGVDEIQRSKGQRYLTMVYQIDAGCRRLIWIGRERTKKSFMEFFEWFGSERSGSLLHICTDMWKPYLDTIARYAPKALNILDRFHLVAKLGLAVDEVRRKEVARLRDMGKSVLVKTRWIWLKRPTNLTKRQRRTRRDILSSPVNLNLRTVRAYFFRLEFDHLWDFIDPKRAGAFLDEWCTKVMRSRLEPIKSFAKTIRKHRPLILNYFKARKVFSSGVVEGLNNKAKVGMRRAYGNRSDDVLEVALFHQLGALPEPPWIHKFCG
jgi:transposase